MKQETKVKVGRGWGHFIICIYMNKKPVVVDNNDNYNMKFILKKVIKNFLQILKSTNAVFIMYQSYITNMQFLQLL